MTTAEIARAQLIATCPWMDPKDVDAFLDPAALPGELETIVHAYRNAGTDGGASTWDTVFKILSVTAQVAGYALPAIGVIQGVIALSKS